MLPKRSLLESASLISFSGTFICIVLHYVSDISPLKGLWFISYIFVVFLLSVLLSCKVLQWLLHLNKPLKYDLESFIREYPNLSFVAELLPRLPKRELKEANEYDTNELSVITTVLERKLVSSWYVPYISEEISFPFACKQMLDQMISKAFQICNKIETKDVYIDICVILTTHLNEYKKALKRHEKAQSSSIESLYKKSHAISDKTKKVTSADHCTNILRVVLKHLVPWELWDTPQSELLVRILSKRLDSFVNGTLADPIWLNEQLLTIIKGKTEITKTEHETEIPSETNKIIEDNNADIENKNDEESPNKEVVTKDTIKEIPVEVIVPKTSLINESILEESVEIAGESDEVDEGETQNENKEEPVKGSEPVEIKATNSPVLRQRRGRQGRNEVKIYDRIIEGSMKTWETDIDLQCISVGQDLLAQLDGEMTLSRLWGQDADETSPNPPKTETSPLWFGEEELELDLDGLKERSPTKKEQSPKPTDAILKDIQITVNQAKNKIGDLQVTCPIDVPCKQTSGDEAAGMMEGLLDFGIAGFKKGLRFTGLGDDTQDKSPTSQSKDKPSPTDNKIESKDMTVIAHKELNGNGVPHLVKQNRIVSQDSEQVQPVVFPTPQFLSSDSPEPQYEEVADLSTSIAKLRCLLSQSPREYTPPLDNESVWWEGAEETRGRTLTHAHTNVDTATLADEYDINSERNTSPNQTSNNMQRLDKLFQRTVTGVFNTIKTAVGADEAATKKHNDWNYVCTSMELSICGSVGRLLGARRAWSHVDAALDSLDLSAHARARDHHVAPQLPDDFDEWCSVVGAGFTSTCNVAVAAGVCRSHVTNRIITILFADFAENLITVWLDQLAEWLKLQIFSAFEQMSDEEQNNAPAGTRTEEVDVDVTCEAVMDELGALKYMIGDEETSSAIKLVISSLTHKEINIDVIYRIIDLFVLHFKNSAGDKNPSFDVN